MFYLAKLVLMMANKNQPIVASKKSQTYKIVGPETRSVDWLWLADLVIVIYKYIILLYIPSGEGGVLLLTSTIPVIAAELRVGQGGNLLLQDLDLVPTQQKNGYLKAIKKRFNLQECYKFSLYESVYDIQF